MRLSLVVNALTAASLYGCVGITYDHETADGIRDAESVSIVRNPKVSEDFITALAGWFGQAQREHKVVDELPPHGWALTYQAHWSWDFAFYLSMVRVVATKDGKEMGFASYDVFAGGLSLDLGKWKEDATVVGNLMRRLYGDPTPVAESGGAQPKPASGANLAGTPDRQALIQSLLVMRSNVLAMQPLAADDPKLTESLHHQLDSINQQLRNAGYTGK